ncbi:MAG: hypothetical protein HQ456_03725, partial [Polynucleobacter sp.]|nr:hypothetical protein [Polynucleobacter sp.]
MRSFIRYALFVIVIFQLSACNTIAGISQQSYYTLKVEKLQLQIRH